MRIKGAIFDLDGTLLDSMSVWETAGISYLKSLGKTPRLDLRDRIITMSLMQAADYFQREYGVKESVQEVMDGIDTAVSDFYFNIVKPKEGIIELLKRFKSRGIKMCVATATNRRLVEAGLKRNGMLEYFEAIVTCTEVGAGKDCPDVFNAAMELLVTKKEETYIFEDALYAIKTAKAAGFPVVAIIDESSKNQLEEIVKLSDVFTNSFVSLEGLL